MTENRYRTTLRPAPFGGVPHGLKWWFVQLPWDHPGAHHVEPRSLHRYGVIETNRPLTRDEMSNFDIVAA